MSPRLAYKSRLIGHMAGVLLVVLLILSGLVVIDGTTSLWISTVAPAAVYVFFGPLYADLTYLVSRAGWPRTEQDKRWSLNLGFRLQMISLGLIISNLVANIAASTHPSESGLVVASVSAFLSTPWYAYQVAQFKKAERAFVDPTDLPVVSTKGKLADIVVSTVYVTLFLFCFIVTGATTLALLLLYKAGVPGIGWYESLVGSYGDIFIPVGVFMAYSQATMFLNYKLRTRHMPRNLSEWGQVSRDGLVATFFSIVNNTTVYTVVHSVNASVTHLPTAMSLVIVVVTRECVAYLCYVPTILLLASAGKDQTRHPLPIMKEEITRWWYLVVKKPMLFSLSKEMVDGLDVSGLRELFLRCSQEQLNDLFQGIEDDWKIAALLKPLMKSKTVKKLEYLEDDNLYQRIVTAIGKDEALYQKFITASSRRGKRRLFGHQSSWQWFFDLPVGKQRALLSKMEAESIQSLVEERGSEELASLICKLSPSTGRRLYHTIEKNRRAEVLSQLSPEEKQRLILC